MSSQSSINVISIMYTSISQSFPQRHVERPKVRATNNATSQSHGRSRRSHRDLLLNFLGGPKAELFLRQTHI